MQIANPIYDVVFKYLMDDNRIAKLIISKIIDQEIVSLDFQPLENRVDIEHRTFTIYRLDFSAKIKTKSGELKQVIIEIQKAKYPTDIMRFRRYLGQQYISTKNTAMHNKRKVAFPIISIYFLGHKLDHTQASIIKVSRTYIDLSTGEEIKDKEEFIESLSHDSYVIQIPQLKNNRRSELENLLSVFDQNNISDNMHILNIREADFDKAYRPLIRRLQRAVAEPEVRNTMDVEDEILEELDNREREIYLREEVIKEKIKTIEEKDKTIGEKDKTIGEKDKTIGEKDKALIEKDKAIEEMKRQIEALSKGQK
jgi:hypothetical protein